MLNKVTFSGRETLLTNTAKKISESPNHKYFSERLVETAEKNLKPLKNELEKKAVDMNEAYKAAHLNYNLPSQASLASDEAIKSYKISHSVV